MMIMLLISAALWQTLRLYILAEGIKSVSQSAVVSVAAGSYAEVYSGIREGTSAAYKLQGSWQPNIDPLDVAQRMGSLLGARASGAVIEKKNYGQTEFVVQDIETSIVNAPLPAYAGAPNSQPWTCKVSYRLRIPLRFDGGQGGLWLSVPVSVLADYQQKF